MKKLLKLGILIIFITQAFQVSSQTYSITKHDGRIFNFSQTLSFTYFAIYDSELKRYTEYKKHNNKISISINRYGEGHIIIAGANWGDTDRVTIKILSCYENELTAYETERTGFGDGHTSEKSWVLTCRTPKDSIKDFYIVFSGKKIAGFYFEIAGQPFQRAYYIN